jgi:hypothetical protein
MRTGLVLSFVVAVLAFTPVGAQELSVDGDFPIVGEPVTVSFNPNGSSGDLILRVVYAPNSETSSVEEIGRVSADGSVEWTPGRFGIATLKLTDGAGDTIAVENVAVLPDGAPATGVLVMLFAGILLFGGAGVSLRSVLRSGVPEQMPPVDT